MSFDSTARLDMLASRAGDYVHLAITNIEREYPHMPWLVVTERGPLPGHRNLHPTFYGSFDWHSCVEMFWVAVRLLRLFPGQVAQGQARFTIDCHLSARFLVVEEAFFRNDNHRSFERPYGWAWLLTLQFELDRWNDPDGRRWASCLHPLADLIVSRFLEWLPRLTYPQRTGLHQNTAFGLLRSMDYAAWLSKSGEPEFQTAIEEAAHRFFAGDTDYPAHYEPSGSDFLSPALTEAELMSRILPADEFPAWLDRFLPTLATADAPPLFTPAIVSDLSDGQIAHLAGLNLSRAASLIAIGRALPQTDPRVSVLSDLAQVHADASLDAAVGSDYMLEHWLAAYATLLLTA